MKNEIRWDPILREWVIVAKNRSVRPVLGKTFTEEKPKYSCPFCPDAPEGAGKWVVKWVPNRFPALVNDPSISFGDESILHDMFRLRPGKGNCEVLLYSQEHDKTLGDLTLDNIGALVRLWKERFIANGEVEEFRYTFIFENRGKVIGVSIAHPHGQLYSFPFIPVKISREVASAEEYKKEKGRCIFCDLISAEKKDGRRIVDENGDFIAFIPFFAKWPLEVHIFPKEHYPTVKDIPPEKDRNFARIIKSVVLRLDGIYGFVMPYVMALHNAPYPRDGKDYSHYHFHIEFYPAYRGPDRIKFLAGVELGTATMINPTNPEENAEKLRNVEVNID